MPIILFMKIYGFPLKFDAHETNDPNELTLVFLWRGEQSNHPNIDRFMAGRGSVCLPLGKTYVTGKK